MLSHLLSAHPPVDGAATSYILPPERERYWLPAGREVKLFEDSGTQLYGTADSATGGRWIQSVRIARAGQTVVVIRAQPEGLLAVNSDLSALRMLAVDVNGTLMTHQGQALIGNVTVTAWSDSSRIIGRVPAETVGVSLAHESGLEIRVQARASSRAAGPGVVEHRQRHHLHLHLEFLNVGGPAGLHGVLPAVWGLAPMSKEASPNVAECGLAVETSGYLLAASGSVAEPADESSGGPQRALHALVVNFVWKEGEAHTAETIAAMRLNARSGAFAQLHVLFEESEQRRCIDLLRALDSPSIVCRPTDHQPFYDEMLEYASQHFVGRPVALANPDMVFDAHDVRSVNWVEHLGPRTAFAVSSTAPTQLIQQSINAHAGRDVISSECIKTIRRTERHCVRPCSFRLRQAGGQGAATNRTKGRASRSDVLNAEYFSPDTRLSCHWSPAHFRHHYYAEGASSEAAALLVEHCRPYAWDAILLRPPRWRLCGMHWPMNAMGAENMFVATLQQLYGFEAFNACPFLRLYNVHCAAKAHASNGSSWQGTVKAFGAADVTRRLMRWIGRLSAPLPPPRYNRLPCRHTDDGGAPDRLAPSAPPRSWHKPGNGRSGSTPSSRDESLVRTFGSFGHLPDPGGGTSVLGEDSCALSRRHDQPGHASGVPIQHVHIPRTAGSSIRGYITARCASSSVSWMCRDQDRQGEPWNEPVAPSCGGSVNAKVLFGPRALGWSLAVEAQRPLYLVVLRDPQALLVSYFDHVRASSSASHEVKRRRWAGASLSEVVLRRDNQLLWAGRELQSSYLTGLAGCSSYGDRLDCALANLDRADVVGVVERLGEVLVQLRHHTDWLGGPEDSSLIDGMPTHSNKSLLTPGAKSLLEELLLQGRGDAKLYRRGSLMAMQRTAMAAGCEQQRAAKGLR